MEYAANGYHLTFFTEQDKRHHGRPVGDWLVRLAQNMGLRGATLVAASEGFGLDRRLHSAHFFELADQPQAVWITVTADECDRLFERLRAEGVRLSYVKVPVEFGELGGG
jgi:PII-like signaling protein